MLADVLADPWYRRAVGGRWDDSNKWDPEGVPNSATTHVGLRNDGSKPLWLGLGTKTYVLSELIVDKGAWLLFGGNFTFKSPQWGRGAGRLVNRGTQTLEVRATLIQEHGKVGDYPMEIEVAEREGTIRLLGEVNADAEITKSGPGTLLLEAPFHMYGQRLYLRDGAIGIAPVSLVELLNIHVPGNINLFALGGDIAINGNLYINEGGVLNIIDNPKDSQTPHTITLGENLSDRGTINQLGHGDLIFEGTNTFEGIINTQAGYGRVVLNGETGANIQVNGGEIAGIGGTRGKLTARNGAIISPGNGNEVGTLTFGDVDLGKSTILNFKLGSISDHINVRNILTLAGNLNIKATSGFGPGTYSLFNYGGELIGNNLSLLSVPEGYDASKFYVQARVVPGEVNLLVLPDSDEPGRPDPGKPNHPGPGKPDRPGEPNRDRFFTFQFWDPQSIVGKILGGSGVWNNTDKIWSSVDGLFKRAWNGYRAIFAGASGRVNVQDNVSFRNIDIIADGYTIHSTNDSKLLADGPTTIKVDSTYEAEISAEIGGTGSVSKIGTGTLNLSNNNNSYTGGTVLKGGTLVANTRGSLSNGPVTLEEGVLRFGNTQTLEIGSYTQNQDAGLALRVNSPTNYDQLVVNGSANLGGTLLIDGKPSNFSVGKEIPLITSQGLNGSRFDNIQFTQTSIKKLFANYDANNVYATAHFDSIYPYAKSPNARALEQIPFS